MERSLIFYQDGQESKERMIQRTNFQNPIFKLNLTPIKQTKINGNKINLELESERNLLKIKKSDKKMRSPTKRFLSGFYEESKQSEISSGQDDEKISKLSLLTQTFNMIKFIRFLTSLLIIGHLVVMGIDNSYYIFQAKNYFGDLQIISQEDINKFLTIDPTFYENLLRIINLIIVILILILTVVRYYLEFQNHKYFNLCSENIEFLYYAYSKRLILELIFLSIYYPSHWNLTYQSFFGKFTFIITPNPFIYGFSILKLYSIIYLGIGMSRWMYPINQTICNKYFGFPSDNFVIKAFFKKYDIILNFSLFLSVIFFFALFVYYFENLVINIATQKLIDLSFTDCVWINYEAISTLGYGESNLQIQTIVGRVVIIIAAVFGLILTSVTVGNSLNRLRFSSDELNSYIMIKRSKIRLDVATEARKSIISLIKLREVLMSKNKRTFKYLSQNRLYDLKDILIRQFKADKSMTNEYLNDNIDKFCHFFSYNFMRFYNKLVILNYLTRQNLVFFAKNKVLSSYFPSMDEKMKTTSEFISMKFEKFDEHISEKIIECNKIIHGENKNNDHQLEKLTVIQYRIDAIRSFVLRKNNFNVKKRKELIEKSFVV